MLILGILVALFVLAMLSVAAAEILDKEGIAVFAGLFGCTFLLFSFIVIIGTPISYLNHIDNVESIQAYQEKIEIQRDRLSTLSEVLEKFNYPDAGTLANSDNPISSVVKEISEVEKDIANRRESISNTERSIRTREAWIFSFTTSWYPYQPDTE